MDRRYGGDPLAPPRPPKLLPRVHRPRAPEPTIMSSVPLQPIQAAVATSTSNHTHSNTNSTAPPTLHQRAVHQTPPPLPPQHHHQHQNSIIHNLPQPHPHNRLLQPQIVPAHPPPRIPPAPTSTLLLPTQATPPAAPTQSTSQHPPQPQPAPITAPLLLSSVHSGRITPTSFSRRRPPPSILSIPVNNIPSVSSNIHSFEQSPQSPVTLAAPRPENERLANEYVDTPFRTPNSVVSRTHPSSLLHGHSHNDASTAATILSTTVATTTDPFGGSLHHHHTHQHQLQFHSAHNQHIPPPLPPSSSTSLLASSKSIVPPSAAPPSNSITNVSASEALVATAATTNQISVLPAISTPPTSSFRTATRPSTLPITKQPKSFGKESGNPNHHHSVDQQFDQHTGSRDGDAMSIVCPQCGRCRCDVCTKPRELPERWICGKMLFCSAQSIVDYSSCLCCVRAVFYHCSKDDEMDRNGDSMSCASSPCSCIPHKRTQRWACLGALSLVLPCLWCYWPMRGCETFVRNCYARHTRHGCRCPPTQQKKTGGVGTRGGTGPNGGGDSTGPGISLGGVAGGAAAVLGGTGGVGAGIGRSISRAGDHTPEKRLLDSSPEY